MRVKIVMENLLCTGCASKIENDINKLEYVKSANYNLAIQMMDVEFKRDINKVKCLKEITKIVNSHEDGVNVYYKGETNKKKKSFPLQYILIGIGAILFIIASITKIEYLYYFAYLFIANNIIKRAIIGLKNKNMFDENTLMFIATLGALYIKEFWEAVAVVLFYSVGDYLQHKAVKKSKAEIESLISLKIESANIIVDGEIIVKNPESVAIDDILLVKVGEQIPVDGIIVKGISSLDTSTMTGESKPSNVKVGDKVLSGTINLSSPIEIRATKKYINSAVSKIIDLIENSTSNKSKSELGITKFAKYYTPFVTITAILLVLIPTLINSNNFNEYIYRAAVFLVISCPCALVLSIPLSYFAGIGKSASIKVLFKGSNYLDDLNKVTDNFTDKTGTLTHGAFIVTKYTSKEVLQYAASIDKYSNHPIAKAIREKIKKEIFEIENIKEIPGMGITGMYNGQTLLVGNEKLMIENKIDILKVEKSAKSIVYVAYSNKYLGNILISDNVKRSSIDAIKAFKKMGINVHMLTGDNELIAKEVSRELGNIDYHSSLLPEEKVNIIKNNKSQGLKLFVGDGINDGPALAHSDIGVSMGKKGSDLAMEVADVIVMDDDLSSLAKVFLIAAKTKRIVTQNIVLALGIKFLFLILGAFDYTTMWMAIFSDVGVSLLAVVNSLRILYTNYNKV